MKSLKAGVVCIFLLALVCLFFKDVLFGNRILVTCNPELWSPWKSYASPESLANKTYRTDSARTYLPRFFEINRAIRDGRLPLWNSYIFMGYPFFADPQSRVLYPISLLLGFTQPERAIGLDLAIHFGIALVGMYVFLLSLGATNQGAILGSLAFGFSSFFFTRMGHPTFVAAASWIPWQFFAFRLANRTRSGTPLLIVTFALGYLAGFPQVFLLGVSALIFYALWISVEDILRGNRSSLSKNMKVVLFAGGIAFLLVSPQLLAFIEFIRNSKGLGIDFATMKTSFISSPWVLLRAFVPTLFGNPVEGTSWLRLINPSFHPYNEGFMVYCGVGSVLVALGGLAFLKSSRDIRAFWALLILTSALALSSSFLRPFYVIIPFLRFSQIDRVSVIACFSLATLTGLSFSAIARGSSKERKGLIVIVLITVSAILFGYLAFSINNQSIMAGLREQAMRFGRAFWQPLASRQVLSWLESEGSEWTKFEIKNIQVSFVIALACASLLLGYVMRRENRWFLIVLAWIFIGITFGDLLKVAKSYYVSQPSGSLRETEGISLLKDLVSDKAGWRIIHYGNVEEVLPANTNVIFEIPSISGLSTLVPEAFARYAILAKQNPIGSLGQRPFFGMENIASARYVVGDSLYPEMIRSPILSKIIKVSGRKPLVHISGGEGKLSIPLSIGDEIIADVRLLKAVSLESYFAFEADSAQADSIYLKLELSGNRQVQGTFGFDLIKDAGKWHRISLDISKLEGGYSPFHIKLTSKYGSHPKCYFGGSDIVIKACQVKPSEGGYVIEGFEAGGSLLMDVSSESPLLRLHLNWNDSQEEVCFITFPLGWRQRIVTASLRRAPGRLVVTGDRDFTIKDAKIVQTPESYVPGFSVIYNGDMVIVENMEAVKKAIVLSKSQTVLYRKDGEVLLHFDPSKILSREIGTCDILDYQPERLEIEVRSDQDAYLLVQDIQYPGWKATVDNAPARILSTNGGMRAVAVPSGRHLVILKYRPLWPGVGLALAIVGLMLGVLYVRKQA